MPSFNVIIGTSANCPQPVIRCYPAYVWNRGTGKFLEEYHLFKNNILYDLIDGFSNNENSFYKYSQLNYAGFLVNLRCNIASVRGGNDYFWETWGITSMVLPVVPMKFSPH